MQSKKQPIRPGSIDPVLWLKSWQLAEKTLKKLKGKKLKGKC